jgi:hypothetical protein
MNLKTANAAVFETLAVAVGSSVSVCVRAAVYFKATAAARLCCPSPSDGPRVRQGQGTAPVAPHFGKPASAT